MNFNLIFGFFNENCYVKCDCGKFQMQGPNNSNHIDDAYNFKFKKQLYRLVLEC